jgi:3-oxoadipate enol-lactonase
MPEVAIGEVMINYQEKGAGFPLLLIHGLSDDSNLWGPVMPWFSRYYRVIALDVRGHGHSSKPDTPYSIPLFSNDLFEFVNKMEIPRANLMGLSMGSAIIQQFTLDHPGRVNSLILLSAFDYVDPSFRDNLVKLRNCIGEGSLPAYFDEAIKLVVTADFISANIEAIEEVKKQVVQINSAATISRAIDACIDFNLKDRIDQITAPTLIISGKEDIFTPLYLAKRIHKSIKGSEWIIIDGVGHNLLVPENIKPLTQIALNFMHI